MVHKFLKVFLLALLVGSSFIFTNNSSAKAATAPRLTKVVITGVTSDGNGINNWETINYSAGQIANLTPLKGTTLYLRVQFTGTPKTPYMAKSGGVNVTTSLTNYDYQYITDSNNIIVGWIQYFKIPRAALPSNDISISAADAVMGNIVSSSPLGLNWE